MLMISRRVGDRIIIDGDIEVVVTEIRRRTVRIGIRGGEGRQILRGEVHDAIQAANQTAAATAFSDDDFAALFEGAAQAAEQGLEDELRSEAGVDEPGEEAE